jgi:hypothetical protein
VAANTAPIYPLTPYANSCNLTAVTACATRAPTVTASLAGANIFSLVPVSTNGIRIDRIQVQGASSAITATTAAQTVLIWLWDGTTAWVIDEIVVTATIPSTVAPAFNAFHQYTNLVLPSTYALYAATTVTTTATTTALIVTAFGGAY